MPDRCRLAILATHPVHYQVDLFRRLNQVPGLEPTVLFCSRFGLDRQVDHTFGTAVRWYDESILEGYPHKFLANLSWEKTPASFFGTLNPGILKETRGDRYDALLVQGYSGLTEWLAFLFAKRPPCRVLFRGETTALPASAGRAHPLRRGILRTLARRVDAFLPIGTSSREFYLRQGIPPERLFDSPYAVENDRFFRQAEAMRAQREEIRKSLGIAPGLPVILCVAKMIPRKRPLDLLNAYEMTRLPATLLFVGDGPLRAGVEAAAKQRRLNHVLFTGFQDQNSLPRFYAAADLFVLPSEYEPWGLVVNEAMCFSLPILTTRGVSSAVDLVLQGQNGFLYDAGEIPALGKHLILLLGDERLRRAMGARSAQIIRRWGMGRAVEGICRGLAGASPG